MAPACLCVSFPDLIWGNHGGTADECILEMKLPYITDAAGEQRSFNSADMRIEDSNKNISNPPSDFWKDVALVNAP